MPDTSPTGGPPAMGLDHVELFVADRAEAAAWYARALGLRDRNRPLVVKDHAAALLAYFFDPYGHRLEVTTCEYHVVRAALPPDDAAATRP